MKKLIVLLIATAILGQIACNKIPNEPEECEISTDASNFFTIQNNENPPHKAFNIFCKKIEVFGITIYATPNVQDANLRHSAGVMAQYLDNNEDGIPDNQAVVDKMVENKAFLMMGGDQSELEVFLNADLPEDMTGQDLYDSETHPNGAAIGQFDAALEEVLHIITHAGYSQVYPSIFGEQAGSSIANAMDIARGGHFQDIPASYPAGAWYTYDDQTCTYGCQVAEYTYWALTSILGAQDFMGRLDNIQHEWQLNTAQKVMDNDSTVYNLLTDPEYSFATVLPDGKYKQ